MSLLQKASIITTPTAYAEDYLYSIKPAYALGSELVTNGTFDTDSNWTKGSAWTISGGKAVYDDSAINSISQSLSFTSQKRYQIQFEVSDATGSGARFKFGNIADTVVYFDYAYYTNGLHTLFYKASANSSEINIKGHTLGSSFKLDNVSVKEVTDADFDFDRNSTGTRVNEDYLIEDVPYNLATYSESINNWTTTNSPTVTTNIAIAPDGTLTADGLQDTTGSNFKRVRTNISVSANSTFTGSCFIKKVSSETGNTGFALVFTGTSTKVAYGIIDSVNGTMVSQSSTITPVFKIESANNDYWRFSMTATDTGSNTSLEFSIYGTLSSNGTSVSAGAGSLRTIWGAQLVKGDQPKDYLKTTDRLDIPRIDYTNGEPSILLEPSRTNLITYSNDFTNATWSKTNATITANQAMSPEGIQNADKYSGTTTGQNLSISISVSNDFAYFFYVKYINAPFIRLRIDSISTWFNIETIEVATNGFADASIEDVGNGWRKITVINTTSGSFSQAFIHPHATDNTTLEQDGGEFYLYGAQLEAGSYATSLIHTSGSTVTRSADSATNAGNSDLINSTEGVLYAEMKALANDSTNRNITLSDGTTTNRIVLKYDNSSNVIQCFNRVAGVETASLTNTVVDITEFKKIAVKYKVNDYALYIDGKEVDTDTTSTTFSASTLNDLSLTPDLHAQVKSIMVFKEALSDEELECLTGYNNHELYMNYYNRLSYLGLAEEYNVESDINNYIL